MTPPRIAYLGLGIMGRGMAANLLKARHSVTVWNRSPEPVEALVKLGAQRADTPADAVKDADLILYCLSNDAAVDKVTRS